MALKVSVSRLTREYVHVGITVTEPAKTIDPATTTADMAFPTSSAEPADGDWVPAILLGDGTNLVARALIGPGGGDVILAPGSYGIWLRLTDFPEQAVRRAGTLVVS